MLFTTRRRSFDTPILQGVKLSLSNATKLLGIILEWNKLLSMRFVDIRPFTKNDEMDLYSLLCYLV